MEVGIIFLSERQVGTTLVPDKAWRVDLVLDPLLALSVINGNKTAFMLPSPGLIWCHLHDSDHPRKFETSSRSSQRASREQGRVPATALTITQAATADLLLQACQKVSPAQAGWCVYQ